MRLPTALLLLAVLPVLNACGGGNPKEDRETEHQMEIPVQPELEGNVASDGLAGASESYIWIGDSSSGTVYRAVSGFRLDQIPADATITGATLEVYLAVPFQFGTPHASLGDMVVDHVDLGGAIDAGDYTGGIRPTIGVLSDTPGPGTRTLDVTEAVKDARTRGLSSADFRMRFVLRTDGDGSADLIMLNGTEDLAESGVTSKLRVTYRQKAK